MNERKQRPRTAINHTVRSSEQNDEESIECIHIHRPKSARELTRRVSFHDELLPESLIVHHHPQHNFMMGNLSSYRSNDGSRHNYGKAPLPLPVSLDQLDWDDFQPIPNNPSVLIRKDALGAGGDGFDSFSAASNSRPGSSRSRPATAGSTSSQNTTKAALKRSSSPSNIFIPRPVSAKPLSSLKSQSARINLEKYRIEQITLRRIRFIIDAGAAKESHLTILSVLENSQIPSELIQMTFGLNCKTIYNVRMLLCRAIDTALKIDPSSAAASAAASIPPATKNEQFSPQTTAVTTPQARPARPAPRKKEVTTPACLLDMLASVEKESNKKSTQNRQLNWKSTIKALAEEKRRSRPNSAYNYTQSVQTTRAELMADLGSNLLSRRLGTGPEFRRQSNNNILLI